MVIYIYFIFLDAHIRFIKGEQRKQFKPSFTVWEAKKNHARNHISL